MNSLRIVFVSDIDYRQSGAAISRHLALAEALRRQGHEVVFSVPGSERPHELEERFPFIVWTFRGTHAQSRANEVLSTVVAARLVRGLGECDAVVAFSAKDAHLLDYAARLARRSVAPLLVEFTEYPDLYAGASLYRRLSYELFRRLLARRIDAFLVISPALEEYIRRIRPDCSVMILPMFVDAHRFPAQGVLRAPTPPQSFAFGYAGSLVNDKDGVDLLLKAFASLRHADASKSRMLRLDVWGEGPDRDSLERLAVELGVDADVRFLGGAESSEIPGLLRSVDCLVLARPVSYQAQGGFPTKLGEYLMSGVPTIVTATGDIAARVEAGVDALVVPPNDVGLLASAMARVVENPELASSLGERGRDRALQSFSSEPAAEALVALIRGLMVRVSV